MPTSEKTIQFSGEEFIKIGEIARKFWENGSTGNPPKFIIIMGGVGSGKTTIRRQKFGNNYVNFDFGEVYMAIEKSVGENDSKLTVYAILACDLILGESLKEKKNIVIEIIGDTVVFQPIISAMEKIGYEVAINAISADPAEAYKRHLKATQEEKDYLSAYFTQEPTLSAFYRQLGLGDIQSVSDKK